MGGVAAATPAAPAAQENDRARRQREAKERDALAAKTRPIKQEIATLEQRIADLEHEKRQIEPQLADPTLYNDYARARPLLSRFDEIKDKLEELYARWEHQQELLDQATRK
jgi:ATP-binding cassette subfamily F protein 3